jgi:hypothetical protein
VAQLIQIAGAILILVGFILAQFKVVTPQALPYLLVNLFGAAALAASAYVEEQWGFVVLEVVWTIVSAWGTVDWLRRRSVTR